MRASRLAIALGAAALAVACRRDPASVDAIPEHPDPPRGDALEIVVTSDGVAWCAGEPILDDATIRRRAEAYHQRRPHGAAHVRCEQAALHGRLVRVLDLLYEAGIPRSSVDVIP